MQKNAPLADRCEKRVSTSNKPYFTLKAGNHQVIGTSQMYASEQSMAVGIASVKTNAPDAEVVDETA